MINSGLLRFISASSTCLLLFIGCAAAPANAGRSLTIEPLQSTESADGWTLKTIETAPPTYRVRRNATSERFFATIIEDCSPPSSKLSPSVPARMRQLLIGFDDISFVDKSRRGTPSGDLHRWIATGALGSDKVLISTYSVLQSGCQIDFVLWNLTNGNADNGAEDTELLAQFQDSAVAFEDYVIRYLETRT